MAPPCWMSYTYRYAASFFEQLAQNIDRHIHTLNQNLSWLNAAHAHVIDMHAREELINTLGPKNTVLMLNILEECSLHTYVYICIRIFTQN